MNKLYLLAFGILSPFLMVSAQDAGNKLPSIIAVSKGDSFLIRSSRSHYEKSGALSNILKIAGVGALAYQSEKVLSKNSKDRTQAVKSGWVPAAAGAGLLLSADKLPFHKRTSQQYVRYILYDKDMVVIGTGISRSDLKTIRRTGGVLLSGTAPADGFISIRGEQEDAAKEKYDIYVVEVIPGPKDHYSYSPVSLSLPEAIGINVTSLLNNGQMSLVRPAIRFAERSEAAKRPEIKREGLPTGNRVASKNTLATNSGPGAGMEKPSPVLPGLTRNKKNNHSIRRSC